MSTSKFPAPTHISVITSLKNINVTSVDSDLQMKVIWRTNFFEGHKFTCEKLRDKTMTDTHMNQAQEDALLEECTDNDDDSSEGVTDSE